jgi:RimJ/RimL family protein N-acetyltransferase
MSYILVENEQLYLKRTIFDELDFVEAAETAEAHFILPYTRDQIIEALVSTEALHCVLVEKVSKKTIGFLLFYGLNNPHRSLELRRIVLTEKGKGYGQQAMELAKQYCFSNLAYHRLWLDVFTDNSVAIAVYEKAGFQREGLLRDTKFKDGVWRSQYLYALLE